MTIAEVKTMLEGIEGFNGKVAYHSFPVDNAPVLPFICFIESNENNFGADGVVYYKAHRIQIELYTKYRDLATEQKIADTLTNNVIFYNMTPIYLEDERCHETIFEIEV